MDDEKMATGFRMRCFVLMLFRDVPPNVYATAIRPAEGAAGLVCTREVSRMSDRLAHLIARTALESEACALA